MPNGDVIEQWYTEAAPVIVSFMATMNVALDSVRSGHEATQASADQLAVSARHTEQWLADHPCPDAAINGLFAKLFESYAVLAHSCDLTAKNPAGVVPVELEQMVGGLAAMAVETLAYLHLKERGSL